MQNKVFRFRLLNSEIGNDLENKVFTVQISSSFRLLNSEIGNDQVIQWNNNLLKLQVFVSLTRR